MTISARSVRVLGTVIWVSVLMGYSILLETGVVTFEGLLSALALSFLPASAIAISVFATLTWRPNTLLRVS
jgi:hypothetical protein